MMQARKRGRMGDVDCDHGEQGEDKEIGWGEGGVL